MAMEAYLPFDGRVAEDRNLLGSQLCRLTAAARRFDQPHSCLIATPKQVASIRSRAAESLPFKSRLERALDRVPNNTETQDVRTGIKRSAHTLIFLAFAALVYEDALRDRILNRIAERLRVLCSLETWNPRPVIRSFLDRAETGIAVALAYDWIYAELDPDLRLAVEQSLVSQILEPAREAYRDPLEEWPRRRDNLTLVSNAGILISALALLPRYRELCTDVLEQGFASMWQTFEAFGPDGAWPEGPSYWSLSARHAGLLVAALESSLGSSFGLASRPGFAETGDFVLHATGPFGAAFDFGDSTSQFDPAALAWLAHRFKRPTDGWLAADYDGWHLPFTLLSTDRPAADPEAIGSPTGKVFRGCDLACFRSTWSRSPGARPVFLAIKGGNTRISSSVDKYLVEVPIHAQSDAGTFIVDGAQTRWVTDLGPDNYDLPGYFEHGTNELPGRRWRYYRTSTAGHNTLVINGKNQLPNAPAPVLGAEIGEECNWIVFDLSPAYGQPPGTIRRGAALIGRHIIIQDEIVGSISGPVDWVIHIAADPVAIGSRIGHFKSGADRFRVQILQPTTARLRLTAPPPAASFAPDPVSEFHGTGVPVDGRITERDRRYFVPGEALLGRLVRRLEIAWPKGTQCLAVLLSPDFDGEPVAIQATPLDRWLAGQPFTRVGPERGSCERKPLRASRPNGFQVPRDGLGRGPPPQRQSTQHQKPAIHI